MFVEVPIKLEQKTDSPAYWAAVGDVIKIINNETEKVRADREREMLAGNMYNMGMIHGFKRIKGLLMAMVEDAEREA